MITAMKYITITGHVKNLNHVVSRYLSRYDIQLEKNEATGLTKAFTTLNPYSQTLQKAEVFAEIVGDSPLLHMRVTASEAVNLVEECKKAYDLRGENIRELEAKLASALEYVSKLQNFISFNEKK